MPLVGPVWSWHCCLVVSCLVLCTRVKDVSHGKAQNEPSPEGLFAAQRRRRFVVGCLGGIQVVLGWMVLADSCSCSLVNYCSIVLTHVCGCVCGVSAGVPAGVSVRVSVCRLSLKLCSIIAAGMSACQQRELSRGQGTQEQEQEQEQVRKSMLCYVSQFL